MGLLGLLYPWTLTGHPPTSWTCKEIPPPWLLLQMPGPGSPWYPPLPSLSTGPAIGAGHLQPCQGAGPSPEAPTRFVCVLGGGGMGTKALWELVPTPSCSTGCTFHSESSRGWGLGEVRLRGGEQSGLLWGESPRELQAWQGLQTQTTRGEGSLSVSAPSVAPSLQAKTLTLYLGHVPRRHRGTRWGVTLNPPPQPGHNP